MEFPLYMAGPLFVAAALASFVFALAETSLFSLGLWRARRLASSDPVRGAAVVRLLEDSSGLLAILVLGNSTANALLVALALVTSSAGGWPVAVSGIVVLAVTLFLCEVTPKALGVRQPDAWALRLARPLEGLVRLTGPLQRLAQQVVDGVLGVVIPKGTKARAGLSDDEYAELLELAHQQGTLGDSEKEILVQVLGLDQRTARDVLRPRREVLMLRDDASLEDMLATARRAGFQRIPLYSDTPDTVVGVLNTRTLLLAPDSDLSEAIEFPSFVPESMNLLQLLEALQRQGRGMAVVVDEFGGVAGVVTLQDILALVVGPIRGEGEAPGFVSERLGPGRWRVAGTMRLEDLRRELPQLGEVEDVDTVGGLVVKLAEVVPAAGTSWMYRGLRMTVREADERRVREAVVEAVKEGAA